MTPSADPTTLHVILENAGGGDGISAVWATVLASLIGALAAVVTTWLNLRHNNKKHLNEIDERKADRLFEAKLKASLDIYRFFSMFRFPLHLIDSRDPNTDHDWHSISITFALLFPDLMSNHIDNLAISAEKIMAIEKQFKETDPESTAEISALEDEHDALVNAYRADLKNLAKELQKDLGTLHPTPTSK